MFFIIPPQRSFVCFSARKVNVNVISLEFSCSFVSWLLLLFSCLVMSHSLRPHGLQHARLPCPSLFPRACSDSRPLSQWCHPTISSSVAPPLLPSVFSQHQGLFHWVGSSHQVAEVLELQHQSFQCMCTTCNRQEPFLKSALVYGTKQLRMHAAYSVKLWVSLRNLGNHMSPVTWGWAFHIVWLQYTLDVQVNLCLVNFFSP